MAETIDKWTVRRAMWRGLQWNSTTRTYDLNPEKFAAGLADLVTPDVMSKMLARLGVDEFMDQMDAISASVNDRCTALVERVVASVEQQGLAVPGIEGSIDRALAAALHSVNVGDR